MNNIDKACNFFKKYPGHLKTATDDIAERLNIDYADVVDGRELYRRMSRTQIVTNSNDSVEEQVMDEQVEDEYQQFLDKHNINREDVTNVYFKEKADGVRFTVQTRFDRDKEISKKDLYEYLKNNDFNLPSQQKDSFENSVAVLNIFDAHIDKLGYVGTGGLHEMSQNLLVLKSAFRKLFDELLEENPEAVILPVGNDFFNTNGSTPATFRGTPQQIGVHWEDSFQAGVNFYKSIIDYMIQYTNVILVNLPGNHDKDKVFYLGQVLQAVYENHSNVDCLLNRDNRKYVFKNNILFGFQHGDIAKKKITKLPSVMSIEQPRLWGQAKHRVWILGDIHHKEEYTSYSTLEDMGVDIKFLRPATSTDKWHTEEMWIGAKKSISYMLYKNNAEQILENELFI